MSCLERFRNWMRRCEFYHDCPNFEKGKPECESGGDDYCGTYKDRKYGRVKASL